MSITQHQLLLFTACQFKRSAVTPEGTFSGYGAVFNNLDAYGDAIAKGAFSATLAKFKARNSLPKMLLQHGGGLLGNAEDAIPVGKWTSMAEDSTGLKVAGQLFALNTQKGQYIYEGLKSGALDGLSIGYVPIGVKYGTGKPGEPERTLTEIQLHEVSIVSFPANDQALISQVKATRPATPRELEALLHRLGFSRSESKRITAGGWPALLDRSTAPETRAAAIHLLRQARTNLTR